MRTKRRVAFVLASVAAFAVGFIAFAASAAADPPACNPGTSPTDNKSCVNFQVLPNNPHNVAKPASLFVHTHTNYAHPGNKPQGGFAKTVTLTGSTTTSTSTPGGAVRRGGRGEQDDRAGVCGVRAGAGTPPNVYLSPTNTITGRASTAPASNFGGCTLVFKGPTASQRSSCSRG